MEVVWEEMVCAHTHTQIRHCIRSTNVIDEYGLILFVDKSSALHWPATENFSMGFLKTLWACPCAASPTNLNFRKELP